MTSRILYYLSITLFVFGIFTYPFTQNVLGSFGLCITLGTLAALVSLAEPDIDRTRRDAVIALCISVVGAVALSIVAPLLIVLWWGPVILMLETIAVVSLIRRHRKNLEALDPSNQPAVEEVIDLQPFNAGQAIPYTQEQFQAKVDQAQSYGFVIVIITLLSAGLGLAGGLAYEWFVEPTDYKSQIATADGDCAQDCILDEIKSACSCLCVGIEATGAAFYASAKGAMIGAGIGLAISGVFLVVRLTGAPAAQD